MDGKSALGDMGGKSAPGDMGGLVELGDRDVSRPSLVDTRDLGVGETEGLGTGAKVSPARVLNSGIEVYTV